MTVDVSAASVPTNVFSKDGAFIFYQIVNGFKAASTAQLDVQILTTAGNGRVLNYVPASKTVYFIADGAYVEGVGPTSDFYRMSLDHSGPRETLATRLGMFSGPVSSPSGRYIAYGAPDAASSRSILNIIDTSNGRNDAHRLCHDGPGHLLARRELGLPRRRQLDGAARPPLGWAHLPAHQRALPGERRAVLSLRRSRDVRGERRPSNGARAAVPAADVRRAQHIGRALGDRLRARPVPDSSGGAVFVRERPLPRAGPLSAGSESRESERVERVRRPLVVPATISMGAMTQP